MHLRIPSQPGETLRVMYSPIRWEYPLKHHGHVALLGRRRFEQAGGAPEASTPEKKKT